MTDYFALLGLERRPWLDPEPLKEAFLALSTREHPDRVHHLGEPERQAAHNRSVELNAAYRCLSEAKDRLRHLLELESGAPSLEVQIIPSELSNLFMEIGPPCRNADQLLAEKATITSPLLKVEWFQRGEPCRERLEDLRQKVDVRLAGLTDELRAVDGEWMGRAGKSRAELLGRLEGISRRMSFFDRWRSQLQDRAVQLNS